MTHFPGRPQIVGIAVAIALLTSTAYARSKGEADIFPAGWAVPTGWHVDRLVKTPVVESDLTGTGANTRAMLMSNGKAVRLMIFVDYDTAKIKAYDVFDWDEGSFKSYEGIRIFNHQDFKIEAGQPNTCGMKDIECTPEKGVMFHPKIPVLWITLGDWGGEVFRWVGAPKGFQRLSSGN